jgi:hypothetical protein
MRLVVDRLERDVAHLLGVLGNGWSQGSEPGEEDVRSLDSADPHKADARERPAA